ncbi:MAG: EAL domain-containing protein [Thermoanaerobaculia bacterium]|nr:EAL domain-containing protein [Thermoanaerobaculia bacterium]
MSYPPGLENAILKRLLSQTTEAYEEQLSALHAEKEFHQITLDSIVDGVITTNEAGMVHSLNPFAENLTGWRSDDAKGRPLTDVFAAVNVDGEPIEIAAARADTRQRKEEATLVRHDGRRFSIEFSSSPLHDRQRNLIGQVIVFQDVTERRLMQLLLAHEATHDSLTGVLNRRAFDQRLRESLRSVSRSDETYGLCYLDLDRFKLVNDTCGHFAGDELLKQVTTLIQTRVGRSGILGRLGGDEFAILTPQADAESAEKTARNIFEAIGEYVFAWGEKRFDVTTSMGVVVITSEFDTVDQVMAAADHCCYLSKELGRNRIQFYDPEDPEAGRHHYELDWVGRIESILEEGSLVLHGQRIHNLGTTRDEPFFEVLIRVGDEGTFLPGEVINAAESYGLMADVDRWVIREMTRELASVATPKSFLCCINVSPLSVTDSEFSPFVESILDDTGLPGETICFEISEATAITSLVEVQALVKRLRKRGCRFALDDFGAGMSSLIHLKEIDFDFVKIHQTFVSDIVNDPQDHVMVEAIHQLAHILGMKTIAESVSSADVAKALERIGVDYGQGFGLSEPVSLREILAPSA